MKYRIRFRYKEPGTEYPDKYVQTLELIGEEGEFIPLPRVGDTVSYLEGNQIRAFKVINRHFSYLNDQCVVSIILVADFPDGRE